MHHSDLSDEELVSQLTSLCLEGKRLLGRLLVHLIEVEDRKLATKNACPSMWEFCVERLGMSHGETSRRLNAARLVRQFPTLLGRIERGEIHLSSLKILGKYLNESNVEMLLDEATRKSKLEVQEIVARHFPRPPVPERVTEVPGTPVQGSLDAVPNSHDEPTSLVTPPVPKLTARIEPLSATTYRVEMTMSKDGWDTLVHAKQLMGHRVPDGNTVAVVEAALKVLVAKLEKERLGKTSQPQSKKRPSKPGHIPQETRREVFARDGEQCTFVDARGRRCQCKTRLELDHIIPRAQGGSDDASNLRVACRAHNRHYAEEIFGEAHVAEKIRCRQRQSRRLEIEDRVIEQTGLVNDERGSLVKADTADAVPSSSRAKLGTPGETIELARKGLVNMGFAKVDVHRALDRVCSTHAGEVLRVESLLREAIAALT